MTEVRFISSVQGFQHERMDRLAERLRKERSDLRVVVVGPGESAAALSAHKLRYGPAVVIDGRLEFVGIPRYRLLVERIAKSASRPSGTAPAAGTAAGVGASPPGAGG